MRQFDCIWATPRAVPSPCGGAREAGDPPRQAITGLGRRRGRPLAGCSPRGGLVGGLVHVHCGHHGMVKRIRASNYAPLQRRAPPPQSPWAGGCSAVTGPTSSSAAQSGPPGQGWGRASRGTRGPHRAHLPDVGHGVLLRVHLGADASSAAAGLHHGVRQRRRHLVVARVGLRGRLLSRELPALLLRATTGPG